MSKDMSTDRFTAVGTSEKSAGAGVALDLVRLQTSENDPGKGEKKKDGLDHYHEDADIKLW